MMLSRSVTQPRAMTGILRRIQSNKHVNLFSTIKSRAVSTIAQNSKSRDHNYHNRFTNALTSITGLSLGVAAAYHSSSAEGKDVGSNDNTEIKFFPPIEAFDEGLLQVSDIHSVYYARYGNPKGKPVLFVHGGPGGGTHPDMARFFDPEAYHIILVDQRGCGKSVPFADLRENTTWDLINDFEKIREKLGIQKWQVFGGSWGSTLGLAYATQHPERVTELVLRGIFLVRKLEIDWLYQGPGANYIFPEDWADYEAAIPEQERYDFLKAYGKRIRGEMGDEEMFKACKAWSIWEGRVSKLRQEPLEKLKDIYGNDHFALAFARIENHFFTNKGFFPRDGYLLEDAQLNKIKDIPTVIVQGRYDVVCPAISAHDLKKKLPKAELVYTLSGHSAFEPTIINELVAATEKFKHNK